ncbi:MAG TPA: thiamine pyrophosphate-dependent enzyme [Pirellulales bacterium]|nr:thiamine pyrophosphate-dependent enzyme [Pirellulales bacterium]
MPREHDLARWLDLYRTMVTAREVDRVELELVRRGLAFFHVSGAGHEGTACFARHLRPSDWLHVHYRDKALLLARGLPLDEFFASLLCRAGSHSEGRQISAHFSAPRLNVLSQTGPVGNHALQAVGIAAALEAGGVLPLPPIARGVTAALAAGRAFFFTDPQLASTVAMMPRDGAHRLHDLLRPNSPLSFGQSIATRPAPVGQPQSSPKESKNHEMVF